MAKRFSHQMSKTFPICKLISFAILTFISIEETPSDLTHDFRHDKYQKYISHSQYMDLNEPFNNFRACIRNLDLLVQSIL